MTSKVKYVSAVLILLFSAFLMFQNVDVKIDRKEQHLTYNTQVHDNNLSIDGQNFSSKLPVIHITTGGQSIPGVPKDGEAVANMQNETIEANIEIFDREGTLHTLQQNPDVQSTAQIRVRGNTSRLFDKVGYLLKFVDEKGEEEDLPVMGMEKAHTWVLHGPYLDKTLMRNYMWYNLSNQIMEWAPEVRYCEVFLDGTYQGVYVMTEQISVGEGRIDISKYDERMDASSYIICVDRPSVNDTNYLNNFTRYIKRMSYRMEVKYPGESKLTPEISEYICKDFSKFEKALYSYDYNSEQYGYQQYIDVDSFVNYVIINEVTQNTDAGIFSTYLYKDITGKLKMCVWDFNNSVDNYTEYQKPPTGFFMQNRTWFFMLMKDEAFVEKVIKRYKELRTGILSDDSVSSYIKNVEYYLGNAIDRNFKVWGDSFLPEKELLEGEARGIGSYEQAVEQYQKRLYERMYWMDEHIEDLYSYSNESVNKKFHD